MSLFLTVCSQDLPNVFAPERHAGGAPKGVAPTACLVIMLREQHRMILRCPRRRGGTQRAHYGRKCAMLTCEGYARRSMCSHNDTIPAPAYTGKNLQLSGTMVGR